MCVRHAVMSHYSTSLASLILMSTFNNHFNYEIVSVILSCDFPPHVKGSLTLPKAVTSQMRTCVEIAGVIGIRHERYGVTL